MKNLEDRQEYDGDYEAPTGITWRFNVRKDPGVTKCIDYLMHRCRYTVGLDVTLKDHKGYKAIVIRPDIDTPANLMMWRMCVWRDIVFKYHQRSTGNKFVEMTDAGCNETLALILAQASQAEEYARYTEECLYTSMTLDHLSKLVLSSLNYRNPEPYSYAISKEYDQIKTYWAQPSASPEHTGRRNFLTNFQSYHEALDFMLDYRDGELFTHVATAS